MSGSCHGKCSRAQITYMCIILTSFSGWAASAVIADFQMAKYQSKSNQCCLENRRLFGFVITCDYWLVNIMTIFFTSLSNRASWVVVYLPASSHAVYPSSYLSRERLYFQRSIIRVVLRWHIVLYYANVWVLYHKVIVHCVLVWQHLLCGCVWVCAGMFSLQVETSSCL